MMTVMVPDLLEPTDEIRGLCTFVARDLHEVRSLIMGRFLADEHRGRTGGSADAEVHQSVGELNDLLGAVYEPHVQKEIGVTDPVERKGLGVSPRPFRRSACLRQPKQKFPESIPEVFAALVATPPRATRTPGAQCRTASSSWARGPDQCGRVAAGCEG
jgi:hypothetical protein